MMTSRNVETAAEAIAAAQLARCGWDVSVQYGANQPEYDLVAVNGNLILKVSVKGSQNGEWGLTQKFLEKRERQKDADGNSIKLPPPDYHAPTDLWLACHTRQTVYFLVQFCDVALSEMPRMYLATPEEIAQRLKETAKNRGDTIIYEKKTWHRTAHGAGTEEVCPEIWKFSSDRLTTLAERLLGLAVPATGAV